MTKAEVKGEKQGDKVEILRTSGVDLRRYYTAGSPFAYRCGLADWGKNCSLFGGTDCCITHTMAFASMLEPALNFTLGVLAYKR